MRRARRHKPAGSSNDLQKGLDHAYVLGFLTFAARNDVEFDALALLEGLIAGSLDAGVVDEHVVTLLTRDKAIALLGVEKLYGSTCQFGFSLSTARAVLLTSC